MRSPPYQRKLQTKESLQWFKESRSKWEKSQRRRVVALPPPFPPYTPNGSRHHAIDDEQVANPPQEILSKNLTPHDKAADDHEQNHFLRDSEKDEQTHAEEPTDQFRRRLIAFYQKHNPSKLDTVDATLDAYRGKEDVLFQKLEAKYVTAKRSSDTDNKKSPFLPPGGSGPICFLEFTWASNQSPQRVVIQLFRDKAPLACENFRCLCTGELGTARSGKPLCYRSSKIHRIVPNFCIQGGDFTKGDGTGGESIYPPNSEHGDMWGKFRDETPFLRHSRKGLLSMANNGPNRNGSQFFVTLRPIPNLDGKHVVFGEVIEGMEVVETIGALQTNEKQRPLEPVIISDCGEIRGNGQEVKASQMENEGHHDHNGDRGFGGSRLFGSPATFFGNATGASQQSSFGSFLGSGGSGFGALSYKSLSAQQPAVVATVKKSYADNQLPMLGRNNITPDHTSKEKTLHSSTIMQGKAIIGELSSTQEYDHPTAEVMLLSLQLKIPLPLEHSDVLKNMNENNQLPSSPSLNARQLDDTWQRDIINIESHKSNKLPLSEPSNILPVSAAFLPMSATHLQKVASLAIPVETESTSTAESHSSPSAVSELFGPLLRIANERSFTAPNHESRLSVKNLNYRRNRLLSCKEQLLVRDSTSPTLEVGELCLVGAPESCDSRRLQFERPSKIPEATFLADEENAAAETECGAGSMLLMRGLFDELEVQRLSNDVFGNSSSFPISVWLDFPGSIFEPTWQVIKASTMTPHSEEDELRTLLALELPATSRRCLSILIPEYPIGKRGRNSKGIGYIPLGRARGATASTKVVLMKHEFEVILTLANPSCDRMKYANSLQSSGNWNRRVDNQGLTGKDGANAKSEITKPSRMLPMLSTQHNLGLHVDERLLELAMESLEQGGTMIQFLQKGVTSSKQNLAPTSALNKGFECTALKSADTGIRQRLKSTEWSAMLLLKTATFPAVVQESQLAVTSNEGSCLINSRPFNKLAYERLLHSKSRAALVDVASASWRLSSLLARRHTGLSLQNTGCCLEKGQLLLTTLQLLARESTETTLPQTGASSSIPSLVPTSRLHKGCERFASKVSEPIRTSSPKPFDIKVCETLNGDDLSVALSLMKLSFPLAGGERKRVITVEGGFRFTNRNSSQPFSNMLHRKAQADSVTIVSATWESSLLSAQLLAGQHLDERLGLETCAGKCTNVNVTCLQMIDVLSSKLKPSADSKSKERLPCTGVKAGERLDECYPLNVYAEMCQQLSDELTTTLLLMTLPFPSEDSVVKILFPWVHRSISTGVARETSCIGGSKKLADELDVHLLRLSISPPFDSNAGCRRFRSQPSLIDNLSIPWSSTTKLTSLQANLDKAASKLPSTQDNVAKSYQTHASWISSSGMSDIATSGASSVAEPQAVVDHSTPLIYENFSGFSRFKQLPLAAEDAHQHYRKELEKIVGYGISLPKKPKNRDCSSIRIPESNHWPRCRSCLDDTSSTWPSASDEWDEVMNTNLRLNRSCSSLVTDEKLNARKRTTPNATQRETKTCVADLVTFFESLTHEYLGDVGVCLSSPTDDSIPSRSFECRCGHLSCDPLCGFPSSPMQSKGDARYVSSLQGDATHGLHLSMASFGEHELPEYFQDDIFAEPLI